MTLNDIITKVAPLYDTDNTILEAWDFTHGLPAPEPRVDTLAIFVVSEIADTFDDEVGDDEQLRNAAIAMQRAEKQLSDMACGLMDMM